MNFIGSPQDDQKLRQLLSGVSPKQGRQRAHTSMNEGEERASEVQA